MNEEEKREMAIQIETVKEQKNIKIEALQLAILTIYKPEIAVLKGKIVLYRKWLEDMYSEETALKKFNAIFGEAELTNYVPKKKQGICSRCGEDRDLNERNLCLDCASPY